MLIFYCNSGNRLKMLEFDWKIMNWSEYWNWGQKSKCWNLSANHQIVQSDVFWMKSGESIKKLTFECNKVGINQTVEIWVQNVKSIKNVEIWGKRGDRSNVDILLQKWKSIKLLEFDWKISNWSEYWNLRTTLRIKMLKFECKMSSQLKCWNLIDKGRLIRMSKFDWKGRINKNIEIWRQSWESIKMLKFWVLMVKLIKMLKFEC